MLKVTNAKNKLVLAVISLLDPKFFCLGQLMTVIVSTTRSTACVDPFAPQ